MSEPLVSSVYCEMVLSAALLTYANAGATPQMILTLNTFAVACVPVPFVTVQACLAGWVVTVTA
jgi:hypothetical protein